MDRRTLEVGVLRWAYTLSRTLSEGWMRKLYCEFGYLFKKKYNCQKCSNLRLRSRFPNSSVPRTKGKTNFYLGLNIVLVKTYLFIYKEEIFHNFFILRITSLTIYCRVKRYLRPAAPYFLLPLDPLPHQHKIHS
jgi:hypothetical protein